MCCVKPEDVAEEHRKYLDIKDNPARVSTSSIFKLVSDGQIKVAERLTSLEVKQDQTRDDICTLDKKVEKVTEELGARVSGYKNEYDIQTVMTAGNTAKFEERFNWQDKMQKLLLSLLVFIIGFLFIIYGIPVPFP